MLVLGVTIGSCTCNPLCATLPNQPPIQQNWSCLQQWIPFSGDRVFSSDAFKLISAKIGIIGLGYVGLPLALLFNEAGFPVTGFDIDPEKVKALNNGRSYIYRIPKTEIAAAAAKGFWATDEYSHAKDMDALIICVPTPLNEYHEPDLSYIRETAKAIAPHVHAGQLIVLESTTYPGTTEEVLIPVLEAGNKAKLKAARPEQDDPKTTFLVAFSPEREDPGNDTVARKDIPKVVGGVNRGSFRGCGGGL